VIERSLGDERRRLEERQQALEKSAMQIKLLQTRLDELKK
jgi:hypothetical protein